MREERRTSSLRENLFSSMLDLRIDDLQANQWHGYPLQLGGPPRSRCNGHERWMRSNNGVPKRLGPRVTIARGTATRIRLTSGRDDQFLSGVSASLGGDAKTAAEAVDGFGGLA